MVFGWFGPLLLAPAWYANIPFFLSLFRIARGRTLGWVPFVAVTIALTVLWPHGFPDLEFGGMVWSVFQGPAIWIWLSSYFVVVAAWVISERCPYQSKHSDREVDKKSATLPSDI